jgi:CheY-like chemotaxis protein
VQDGEEALDYLLHRGRYKDASLYPMPDLLLLDLNMPKLDGREVLRQMADYPIFRRIATVVLTTSSQEQDVMYSYDLGAKSYIAKPENLERYKDVVRVLENYWFHIVMLPPRENVE